MLHRLWNILLVERSVEIEVQPVVGVYTGFTHNPGIRAGGNVGTDFRWTVIESLPGAVGSLVLEMSIVVQIKKRGPGQVGPTPDWIDRPG